MKTHAFRFKPGQDLYQELKRVALEMPLRAGSVLTCVGSFSQCTLRLAGAKEVRTFDGPFEIVSLVGTLCTDGVHLHVSISDSSGQCTGGHLQPGSLIHTTAEIVLAESETFRFSRAPDPETGYSELLVSRSS
jgi:predicted DNA-binding protein with PD1-like motif